ncbi:unnamed protein product [Clonostachys rosea]|uniref:Uncharacterized protein n=1 Tax=Bionectria ochroleuca TaxID=29856 RepID=A0ABY6UUM8_BIOOC|nr:unnamed protein product [Clonostachys rosea]
MRFLTFATFALAALPSSLALNPLRGIVYGSQRPVPADRIKDYNAYDVTKKFNPQDFANNLERLHEKLTDHVQPHEDLKEHVHKNPPIGTLWGRSAEDERVSYQKQPQIEKLHYQKPPRIVKAKSQKQPQIENVQFQKPAHVEKVKHQKYCPHKHHKHNQHDLGCKHGHDKKKHEIYYKHEHEKPKHKDLSVKCICERLHRLAHKADHLFDHVKNIKCGNGDYECWEPVRKALYEIEWELDLFDRAIDKSSLDKCFSEHEEAHIARCFCRYAEALIRLLDEISRKLEHIEGRTAYFIVTAVNSLRAADYCHLLGSMVDANNGNQAFVYELGRRLQHEKIQVEIFRKEGATDGSTPHSIRRAFARFVSTPYITGEDFRVEDYHKEPKEKELKIIEEIKNKYKHKGHHHPHHPHHHKGHHHHHDKHCHHKDHDKHCHHNDRNKLCHHKDHDHHRHHHHDKPCHHKHHDHKDKEKEKVRIKVEDHNDRAQ